MKRESIYCAERLAVFIVFLVSVSMLIRVGAIDQQLGLEVKWVFNTSAQVTDKSFGAGHQGCFTVWDVDGDGVNEVLFGTRRGDSKRLWCINADGTFQWMYPPLNEDGLPGDPTSVVSLVDVNNDGVYELCLAGRGGRLHVLNGDGNIVWTWDNPNPGQAMHGAPQAFDVDGDGFVEFFLNDNPGYVHRVSHNGEWVWTSFQCGSGNQGHPTICDIDRDGEYEVIWACMDHHVYCVSAKDASLEWKFDTGGNIKGKPVIVADVNKDGEYEAVTWNDEPGNSVYILSYYGKELGRWTSPHEGANIRIGQPIGDIDGDGNLDMAVMDSKAVYCIDLVTTTTKWEVNFTEWSEQGLLPPGATVSHWSSYQTIADIDGDGELEILWLAPFPIITDGATGRLEAYYLNEHVAINRRQENGGWWGDVDGDGISEWICELNGLSHPQTQVYSLTMNGNFPAESPWPEYYHSAYPAEYQNQQDWLTLKSAYSNSLWFPMEQQIPELGSLIVACFLVLFMAQQPISSTDDKDHR